VETYERIEDEQARLQFGDSLGEVAAVGIQIEPDGLGRTPNRRGTKVRFKPDAQIFGDKAKFTGVPTLLREDSITS
jgi:hypothetical protein